MGECKTILPILVISKWYIYKYTSVCFDGGVQNYTAYTGDFKMVHLQIYKRLF